MATTINNEDYFPPIETDGGEGMRQVLIPAARQYGRLSQQMKEFYLYCKAGKNVVFRMPEGDIYSPEALKAQISLLQSQVLERVEKRRKDSHNTECLRYMDLGWKDGKCSCGIRDFNEGMDASKEEINKVFKL